MSHLSTQECTAGISRSALATLKKHGSNGDTPHATKHTESPLCKGAVAVGPASTPYDRTIPVRDPMSGKREFRVIDTPFRQLSLLEDRDGNLMIRNAEFIGSKCDVAIIHLEREQARTLGLELVKQVHREDA